MEQPVLRPEEIGQLFKDITVHISGPDGRRRYEMLMRYLKGEIRPHWLKTDLTLSCSHRCITELLKRAEAKQVIVEEWVHDALKHSSVTAVQTNREIPVTFITPQILGFTGRVSLLQVMQALPTFASMIQPLPSDAGINLRNQLANQALHEELYVLSTPVHVERDTRDHLFRLAHYKGKSKKSDGLTISLVRIAPDRMVAPTTKLAVEQVMV